MHHIYVTVTVDAPCMDSMIAVKRLHRSYGECGRIFGGSFNTMRSLEQSRSLGRNWPNFICRFSVKKKTQQTNQ
ncbi:hypothetical protein GDO86_012722 [Hymenochirus boettgeri]|uniref:Uncharacterized protein n=1 Tax=Hymenochirus boettgeri TaxID=247094 RepID=A0A8T2ITR5_9PIPI|nr:hypothetical protein GDO86_012722 [Hymenochirus boettgeri]